MIPLGVRHAEIRFLAFFEVASLILGDYDGAKIVQARKTGQNRSVVSIKLVAVKFDKFVEDHIDIVDPLGSIRMTRDLDGFPRGKIGVNLLRQFRDA